MILGAAKELRGFFLEVRISCVILMGKDSLSLSALMKRANRG